jgi:excisionase family DNA binding protein
MTRDTLISIKEAAKQLGDISPFTVRNWIASGKLRRTKVGRRTMLRESELQKVIREEQPKELLTA